MLLHIYVFLLAGMMYIFSALQFNFQKHLEQQTDIESPSDDVE